MTETRRSLRLPTATLPAIDRVTDPNLLAHQLLDFNPERETREYARKLRMSGIAEVCVREQLLGIRHGLSFKRFLDVGMQMTFDLGHGIHDYLQHATGIFGNSRLGWWQCLACGHRYFGRLPVANCRKCKAPLRAIRFREHTLKVPDHMPVSGHPDQFLEVAPGDIRVVDFKTINGDDFKNLSAPYAAHVIQVTGYMEYLQYDTTLPVSINPDRGLVLYLSKRHVVGSLPVKAFHVVRSKPFVDLIHGKVADFSRGLAEEDYLPPPLTACASRQFMHGRAKQCPAAAICRDRASREQGSDASA